MCTVRPYRRDGVRRVSGRSTQDLGPGGRKDSAHPDGTQSGNQVSGSPPVRRLSSVRLPGHQYEGTMCDVCSIVFTPNPCVCYSCGISGGEAVFLPTRGTRRRSIVSSLVLMGSGWPVEGRTAVSR